MWGDRALRDHMNECLERGREMSRRLEQVAEQTKESMSNIRQEMKERHNENAARFQQLEARIEAAIGKIDSIAWKVMLIVLAGLVAGYFGAPHLLAHG